MTQPQGIVPLRQFLDSLESAEHSVYAARPSSRVAHEDAFSEMKTHIVNLYEGVDAPHSFVDENGAVYDCIPVEQQPALRGSTEEVPTAPDLPSTTEGEERDRPDSLVDSPLSSDRKDYY